MGGSPELTPPRLVGRDREVAHVRRWLAAAETGRGGVLVLHGDAGLGKTRMVQEIARAAQARGMVLAVIGLCGLRVASYAPATVKQAVSGSGNATKDQVTRMVQVLIGLRSAPFKTIVGLCKTSDGTCL